jgi:FAD:protein FMN transferase
MIKKFKFTITAVIIILVIILGNFLSKNPFNSQTQSQTRFLLDTVCKIQVPGEKERIKSIEKAFTRIEEIDKKFNALNPESQIYKFNNSNISITDPEIVQLAQTALKVSEITQGAYDITVFPLVEAWGFYTENPALPDSHVVTEALSHVGYKLLKIENGTLVKLRDDVKIDFGSIAKGYAVGEAVKSLINDGIKSALVDGGGDIYALGKNYGKLWKIGIKNPRGDGVAGALDMEDMTAVTSGDYERYFEKDGIRYHHILDPRTGYPARGIESLTVLSNDATLADAWSTALFVLGKDNALELAKKMKSFEILIIDDNGEKFVSPGLEGNIETIRK